MGKRGFEHRLDVLDWLLFKGDDYDPPASAPSLLERLEALEAKARDYQEDGNLAVEVDYGHEAGMLYALQQRAETAERDRDEARESYDRCRRLLDEAESVGDAARAALAMYKQRAETAERERDEDREAREVWKHATREFKAERDAARAALARIVNGGGFDAVTIAADALNASPS